MAQYTISDAVEADLLTLVTLCPCVPQNQGWWIDVFRDCIRNENARILAIFDEAKKKSRRALAVLLLEKRDGSEGLSVFDLLRYPPTAGHDIEKHKSSPRSVRSGFDKHTSGRVHFNIAIVRACTDSGAPDLCKKLLDRAREFSDAEGIDIFVQVTKSKSKSYLSQGFVAVEEVVVPETNDCIEVVLQYKSSNRSLFVPEHCW